MSFNNVTSSPSSSPKPQHSITGTASPDSYGLGSTPGQRGAEILAGLRANQNPSPENLALSRMSGRVIARIMLGMIRDTLPLNFTLARPMVIDGIIRKSLANRTYPVIVDIAAGLAPRGIHLAKEYPQSQVIEIDLPEVIAEKQRRLQRKHIDIPSNLIWLTGDLAVTPLSAILGEQKAHIISAEGLLPYLDHNQIKQLGRWVSESLYPGGIFVADAPLRKGVQEIQQLASFFSRQAGNWYGILDEEMVGVQLLMDSGFDQVETYVATDFADEFKLPMPMIDVSCFMVATTVHS